MSKELQFEPYSEEYKQIIKQEWYKQGRPGSKKLLQYLPVDEHGRKPNPLVIDRFRKEGWWDVWADEMDSQVMMAVEDTIITEKANMLKRHAQVGWTMIDKGMEFLVSGTFDSSSSAVAAIKAGVEIERISRGVGEMLVKMAQMDNGAITQEIIKLVNRASENNQIIDADLVPEKEETPEE